jgi:hypothetical protein
MLSSMVCSVPSILFKFEELCPYIYIYIYIYMFDSFIYMFWIHGKVPKYTFMCSSCFEIVVVLKGVLQFFE